MIQRISHPRKHYLLISWYIWTGNSLDMLAILFHLLWFIEMYNTGLWTTIIKSKDPFGDIHGRLYIKPCHVFIFIDPPRNIPWALLFVLSMASDITCSLVAWRDMYIALDFSRFLSLAIILIYGLFNVNDHKLS